MTKQTNKISYLAILLAVWLAPWARAADLCELYVEFCPGYVRNVVSGGTYPSFSDTFNVNPASIPTTETPIGIEAITTTGGDRTSAKTNFALIKGFNRAGFGIANNSDETLYSYNVLQALQGTDLKDSVSSFSAKNSVMSSINIGSAIAPLEKKAMSLLSSPHLGINFRYNELTQKWDLQYGFSLNWTYLTLGASHKNSEAAASSTTDPSTGTPKAVTIPAMSTTSYTAGTKLGVLGLEYTMLYLKTPDPTLKNFAFFTKPVLLLTALIDIERLHLSYARREAYNVLDTKITTNLFGAQLQVLKKLAVAYQHNYIPGTNSLSVQMLF